MNQTFKNLLAAAIVASILLLAWGIETLRDNRPGLFGRLCLWTAGIGIAALALVLSLHFAHAHDHANAELDGWYQSLRSGKGACCDGTDAMHLKDIDWATQNVASSRYRVKIPVDKIAFDAAMRGEAVDTMWIDVPPDAVLDESNKAGTALVWPLYGYSGASIRCFMPGEMS